MMNDPLNKNTDPSTGESLGELKPLSVDAQPAPAQQSVALNTLVSSEEKTWGLCAHLSPLLTFVIPIPFMNVIAPLVLWQAKKDTLPFVAQEAKEALNFQITVSIAAVVLIPFCFILIGIPFLLLLVISAVVFCVIAALKANDGVAYRYPVCFRFVK